MLTVCKDNHYLKNGLRRPKADKGVLEGLPPPRIMSRQANGGGRPQCDDEERQPLGAGRVCESHHRGQNVLRIPLVPERIPAVENEKTLTRVSDKQEFTSVDSRLRHFKK